jgi:hypothetical protein
VSVAVSILSRGHLCYIKPMQFEHAATTPCMPSRIMLQQQS